MPLEKDVPFWDEAGTACFQRLVITYMARKSLEGHPGTFAPSLGLVFRITPYLRDFLKQLPGAEHPVDLFPRPEVRSQSHDRDLMLSFKKTQMSLAW